MASIEMNLDAASPDYEFHKDAAIKELKMWLQEPMFRLKAGESGLDEWPIYVSVGLTERLFIGARAYDYPVVFGNDKPDGMLATVLVESLGSLPTITAELDKL
jgi:hypothetical protein